MAVEISGITAVQLGKDFTGALTKDAETSLPLIGLDANAAINAIQEGAIRGIDYVQETAAAEGLTVKIKKGSAILKTKDLGTGKTWRERFDKEGMEVAEGDAISVSITDTSTTPAALNNVSVVLYIQMGKSEI